MFWGLIMEPGKRYAQCVEKSFHISKACLDLQASGNEPISIYLDTETKKFLLCVLQKAVTVQTSLDLNFMVGDRIAFLSVGKGTVHLTGYLHDTEDDLDDTVLSEEESEEEIIEQAKQEKPKKRNSQTQPSKENAKKLKLEEESEDDSDVALSDLEGEEEEDDDEMEEDDGDDDDEDDDDEDDESDEIEVQQPVEQLPQKKNKKKKQKAKKIAQSPVQEGKDKKAGGGQTPKVQSPQVNGTPNAQQSGKKNKKKGGETPGVGGTPKPQQSPQSGQTPQKRTIEGGVSVEDLKVGNGGVAKPGRLVTVYYTGRLKQNNKQFDATNQGPGFKFRLGKGEVIKGWDIGLNGMKVGGKRKIVIPAHMAYGAKGSPPVIPPNSGLVFEVELRNVN